MNVKDIWFSKEYDKIRENENIRNRVMFTCFGGYASHQLNVC